MQIFYFSKRDIEVPASTPLIMSYDGEYNYFIIKCEELKHGDSFLYIIFQQGKISSTWIQNI